MSPVLLCRSILAGDPKYSPSQDVSDFPYGEYARSLGLGGLRGERADDVAPAWEESGAQMRSYFAALLRVKATTRAWWAGTFPETVER